MQGKVTEVVAALCGKIISFLLGIEYMELVFEREDHKAEKSEA